MHSIARSLNLRTCVLAVVGLLAAGACDSTSPPKPVAIVFVGDANQAGTVAQIIVPGPQIQIRDDKGNPLTGVAFTVTVNGGGALTGAPAKTVSGSTALGTWTLGQAAGTQSLTVQSAGVTSLTITATANAGPPATSSAGGVPLQSSGIVGAISSSQPQIQILDAFGNAVAGLPVVVTVFGGGSVQNANPVTNSAGIASVGAWTLGTAAGSQRVALGTNGLVPPITFTAVVDAGPAVAMAAVGVTSAAGTAGQASPIVPSVMITDAYGNGVAGKVVTATVGSQSGSVATPSSVTNSSGVASSGSWTLGATAGTQTVTMSSVGFAPVVFTVTATVNQYTVEVRFVGGVPSAPVQAAFLNAAARIQQVVVGDLANIPFNNVDVSACFDPAYGGAAVIPPLNETIDDLVIYARVNSIDGPGTPAAGNILGFARPCYTRTSNGLTVVGMMQFDDYDVPTMLANGTFGNVVLHEMLHVVGIGSLWQGGPLSFLAQGLGGANPIFLGTNGRQRFQAANGNTPSGVPIENIGGPGTADSHWRQQNLFVNELMTGTIFVGTARPFSAISIAALQDFGYTVSYATADPFAVQAPGSIRAAESGAVPIMLGERVLQPMFRIDEQGRVTPIIGAAPPPSQKQR